MHSALTGGCGAGNLSPGAARRDYIAAVERYNREVRTFRGSPGFRCTWRHLR